MKQNYNLENKTLEEIDPWFTKERQRLYELSEMYRIRNVGGTRADCVNIVIILNEEFRNGEKYWTPPKATKELVRYKTRMLKLNERNNRQQTE